MTAPEQVVTPAQLAAHTQGLIAADDPRAEGLLRGVVDAVRSYCGWHVFPVREDTLTVDGTGGKLLQLPSTRVVEVTEVAEDDEPLPQSAYRWSADGTLSKRVGCWSREFRSVTVTLRHGVQDTADLTLLVLQVAARLGSSPMGWTREQVGGINVSHGLVDGAAGTVSFLAEEYARLDPYRAVLGGDYA
ncbi:hypothetical protein ACFTSD_02735 [Nocardiaceae bacterium NPDC056970]